MCSLSPLSALKNQLENGSFSSINYESEADKSQNISDSSNSNRGFSIKDICPDVSVASDLKHKRIQSQQLDLLSPQYLFSHMRKNSKASFSDIKQISIIPEGEDFGSTRMHTSQSRKISDYEVIQPVVVHEPELNIEKDESLRFCKNCNKEVITSIAFPSDNKAESVLLEVTNMIFMCWTPRWLSDLKVEVCVGCGFAVK